jgi:hypothetical protein
MHRLLRSSLVAATLLMAHTVGGMEESTQSATIQQAQIDAAIEKLRSDPDLATTRQVRTLRWANDEDKQARDQPSWLKWIAELFRWFADVSRVFIWLLIALLVGLFVLYLLRFGKTFGKQGATELTAPTHVQELDIRPESLPHDIGSAAWDLWERGEHRDALSLLYRGLLSRLAHGHAVPIRHSSTEGDCLTLAERHLSLERHSYVARLIRTYQRAIYGGDAPQSSDMRMLCDEFGDALSSESVRDEGVAK